MPLEEFSSSGAMEFTVQSKNSRETVGSRGSSDEGDLKRNSFQSKGRVNSSQDLKNEMVQRAVKRSETTSFANDHPKFQSVRSENSARQASGPPWIHRKSSSAFFATVIILNALMIGLEVDLHDDNGFSANDTDDLIWLSIELAFIVIFCTELGLRLKADGLRRCMKDPWNCFDAFLISVGIVENIMMAVLSFDMNFTFMRLLRLVRLARIVRMLRFFKALFLLLLGMYNALRMIIWMLILLWSLIYLCSIIARQTIATGTKSKKYFGSMSKCMITFFQLSTVEDWPLIYEETTSEYPWFGVIIIAFIFFTNMLLLNLITGVIVENTLEITRTDEEEQLQQLDEMKIHCLKEFDNLLRASDINGNNLLDREELEQLLDIFSDTKQKNKFYGAMKTLIEERSCAILKWFPAKDLLSMFDLCEAKGNAMQDQGGGIPISSYLDVIGRSIGVRGGIARAQDQIVGQYEVISVIHEAKGKLLEACDTAAGRIDAHMKRELEQLEDSVRSCLTQTTESIEKLAVELSGELQVALEELKDAAMEALPKDAEVFATQDPECTEPKATAITGVTKEDRLCVPLSPEDEESLAALEGRIDRLVTTLLTLVQAFRGEVAFSAEMLQEHGAMQVGGVLDGLDLMLKSSNSSPYIANTQRPQRVVYPTSLPVLNSSLIAPLPQIPLTKGFSQKSLLTKGSSQKSLS